MQPNGSEPAFRSRPGGRVQLEGGVIVTASSGR
jgi:hypothetical protein